MVITVEQHPFESPEALQLITELDAELSEMYADVIPNGYRGHPFPGETAKETPFTNGVVVESPITFFVAYMPGEDGRRDLSCAAGCVVLLTNCCYEGLPTDKKVGELKRMYVRSKYRKCGAARALMIALEKESGGLAGVDLLVLSTGPRQVAAHRLYEQMGWSRREAFGEVLELDEEIRNSILCYDKVLR